MDVTAQITVSRVFAFVYVIGCYLAGLGGALVAPTQNITQGMDHAIIIEVFLIVDRRYRLAVLLCSLVLFFLAAPSFLSRYYLYLIGLILITRPPGDQFEHGARFRWNVSVSPLRILWGGCLQLRFP